MPHLMKKGSLYDLEDSLDMLMEYGVIFIGEGHGSRVSHEAELAILKGLSEQDLRLIPALDLLDRDAQDVLKEYG